MFRLQEEKLWDFCTRQHKVFNQEEWLLFDEVDHIDLALAAAFLSMSNWF